MVEEEVIEYGEAMSLGTLSSDNSKKQRKSSTLSRKDFTDDEALEAFPGLSLEEIEDLFNKNTSSFRCLAQLLISRSSLLRDPLYHFPVLVDPGIDDAFDYVEPEVVYDDIGCEKYKAMCKDRQMVPISRVLNSLPTDTLNLKYYGLSGKQVRAITETLMLNTHIKNVIFQDNWMTPESVYDVGEMLRENNCIEVLDMRECRIGPEGIANLIEGLGLTQTLVELDLSRNDLGDAGIKTLCKGLRDNQQLSKLDISHNQLGDKAGVTLGNFLKENTTIDWLDLSWNDFYNSAGTKPLFTGLLENQTIKYLNMAWNAIGTKECLSPIIKYMRTTEVLEHLDLSNNRIMDFMIRMVRAGIQGNSSLKSINLGFNLITPSDALFLLKVFTLPRDDILKLEYMDLENVFVEKNFLQIWRRLTKQGKSIRIQGIIGNYKIHGPNQIKLLFERARFLAQKPKKKKKKKDFGHFLYSLPEEKPVSKKELAVAVRKFKMKKVDVDLQGAIIKKFEGKLKDTLNLPEVKKAYMEMYPDTIIPEKKKKKGKGKKGKKGKKKDLQVDTPPVKEATLADIILENTPKVRDSIREIDPDKTDSRTKRRSSRASRASRVSFTEENQLVPAPEAAPVEHIDPEHALEIARSLIMSTSVTGSAIDLNAKAKSHSLVFATSVSDSIIKERAKSEVHFKDELVEEFHQSEEIPTE